MEKKKLNIKAWKNIVISFVFLFQGTHLPALVFAGTSSEPQTASFQEVQKEAESGNANAQYTLGRMYQNGTGVAIDNKKAVEWYTKAVEKGNANAQYNLGVMYQNGDGVVQDKKRAVELIGQAAEQGFAWAEYTLGVMYQNGDGVAADRKTALQWYTKAAEKGNPKALFTLGLIYENDERDDKKASEVYTRADEQGYVIDQNTLEWKHHPDDGIPADKKKALEFYKQAAEQGYVAAQLYLGWLYFGGIGTEKSDREAYKWWGQAAKTGNENAQHNIILLCRTNQSACKTDAPNPEAEMWSLVKGSGNLSDVDKFLKRYPRGQYTDSAQLLRNQLLRQEQESVRRAEDKKIEEEKQKQRQEALVAEKNQARATEQKAQDKLTDKPASKESVATKETPAHLIAPSPAIEEKKKNVQTDKTKKPSQTTAPPLSSSLPPPEPPKEQVVVKDTSDGYKAALFPFYTTGDASPYSGMLADRIFLRIGEIPGLIVMKSYYKFKGIDVMTGISGKELFTWSSLDMKTLSKKASELGINIAILGRMDIRCKDSSQGTNSCDNRTIEVSIVDLTTGKVYAQTARTGIRPTDDAIDEACKGAFTKFKADMRK